MKKRLAFSLAAVLLALLMTLQCAAVGAAEVKRANSGKSYNSYVFEPKGGAITLKKTDNIVSGTAKIGNTTYNGTIINDTIVFEYPKLYAGIKIKITLCDKNGNETRAYNEYGSDFTVTDTIDYDRTDNLKVLPKGVSVELSPYVKELKYQLCAEIDGQTFRGDYVSAEYNDEVITLTASYPTQKKGTEILLSIESRFGAVLDLEEQDIQDKEAEVKVSGVTPIGMTAWLSPKGETESQPKSAAIKLNGEEYKGKFSDNKYKFSYKAKSGDKAKVSISDTDGYVFTKTVTIPKGDGKLESLACNADRAVFRFNSKKSKIKSVTLWANGKKSKVASYTKKDYKKDKKDYFWDFDNSFKYSDGWIYKKSAYVVKVGKPVKVTVETKDGYVYTIEKKAKHVEPFLELDNVYSNDTTVQGDADPRGKVTLTAGKKKYTVKPSKSGRFKAKIKPVKSGTKISAKITIKKYGYKAFDSVKVKLHNGEAYLKGTTYVSSRNIKVKYYDAYKGDMIRLRVGGKLYKYSFKKNSKKGVYAFSITPAAAGSKIAMNFTDCHGKSKGWYASEKDRVYIGNRIYIGMSAHDCQLTTWGYPVRRNAYPDNLQWVFESGDSTLYVYIENGRVTDWSRYNY